MSKHEPLDLGTEPPRVDVDTSAVWRIAEGSGHPVDLAAAVALAEEAMNSEYPRPEETMAVLAVHEADFGWVFVLQSTKYIQSRAFSDQLVGHGVTIVDKETGNVYASGGATSPWKAIHAFLNLRDPGQR